MKVEIVLGDEFKRQFKRLAKKYPSLKDDFITFKKELADDPFQGSDLGNGTRKVRMAIASKGKGKSGGAGGWPILHLAPCDSWCGPDSCAL